MSHQISSARMSEGTRPRNEPLVEGGNVEQRIRALSSAIDELEKALQNHVERISPILLPAPGSPLKDAHPTPVTSPLADRIGGAGDAVFRLTARVRAITEAVDL